MIRMRLIDADITIKELNDRIARLDARQQIYMENGLTSIADSMARKIELCIECRELLEHQPTAYDVDGIIHRLDDASFLVATSKEFWDDPQNGKYVENVVRLSDAIEIVKWGGKSDK